MCRSHSPDGRKVISRKHRRRRPPQLCQLRHARESVLLRSKSRSIRRTYNVLVANLKASLLQRRSVAPIATEREPVFWRYADEPNLLVTYRDQVSHCVKRALPVISRNTIYGGKLDRATNRNRGYPSTRNLPK